MISYSSAIITMWLILCFAFMVGSIFYEKEFIYNGKDVFIYFVFCRNISLRENIYLK